MDTSQQLDYIHSLLQGTDAAHNAAASKSPSEGSSANIAASLVAGRQNAPSGLSLVHSMNTGGRFTPGRRFDVPTNPYKRAKYEKQQKLLQAIHEQEQMEYMKKIRKLQAKEKMKEKNRHMIKEKVTTDLHENEKQILEFQKNYSVKKAAEVIRLLERLASKEGNYNI